MKLHKTSVLAGALVLGLGGSGFAAEGTPSPAPVNSQGATTQSATPPESTHGDTVSEFARDAAMQRQESMPPPDDPPGSAISPVAQGQRDWTQLDIDGDGVLSDAEIQADSSLAASVPDYDADGDGQITRAEFDAYLGATAGAEIDDAEFDDGYDDFE